jgi:hypothetical protein
MKLKAAALPRVLVADHSEVGGPAHRLDAPLADLGGEHRAGPVPPEAHGFMADVDATLGEKVLHIKQ